MNRLARYRKTAIAALGVAATVAATIPPDTALWRWAELVLAVATVAGVRQIRNAPAAPVPPEAARERIAKVYNPKSTRP